MKDQFYRNVDSIVEAISNYSSSLGTEGKHAEIDIDSMDVVKGTADFRIIVRDECNPNVGAFFSQLYVTGSVRILGGHAIVGAIEAANTMMVVDEGGCFKRID